LRPFFAFAGALQGATLFDAIDSGPSFLLSHDLTAKPGHPTLRRDAFLALRDAREDALRKA
jgi:hypothetical protein